MRSNEKKMNFTMLLYLALGGAVGATVGYFGKCASGTCVLAANWRRGALMGAAIGFMTYLASGTGNAAAMNESTANVKRIGQAAFENDVLQSTTPVLVDFYATWCGPCRILSPTVDKVAGQLHGKIKFFKVNVDEAPALAQRFEIDGIPALLIFKDGKVADRMVGVQSEAMLKNHLSAVESSSPEPGT